MGIDRQGFDATLHQAIAIGDWVTACILLTMVPKARRNIFYGSGPTPASDYIFDKVSQIGRPHMPKN